MEQLIQLNPLYESIFGKKEDIVSDIFKDSATIGKLVATLFSENSPEWQFGDCNYDCNKEWFATDEPIVITGNQFDELKLYFKTRELRAKNAVFNFNRKPADFSGLKISHIQDLWISSNRISNLDVGCETPACVTLYNKNKIYISDSIFYDHSGFDSELIIDTPDISIKNCQFKTFSAIEIKTDNMNKYIERLQRLFSGAYYTKIGFNVNIIDFIEGTAPKCNISMGAPLSKCFPWIKLFKDLKVIRFYINTGRGHYILKFFQTEDDYIRRHISRNNMTADNWIVDIIRNIK